MRIIDSKVSNVNKGANVVIMMPSNLYDCTLKDEVFIGPFTEVQSGAIIGDRTRVQSHSFICSCVEIGQDCFIGHGVMFINDDFKIGGPQKDNTKWGSTKIGNNVSIGSNATILCVEICDGVVIGAGSVVSKSIYKSGIYAGNPAKFIREI